MQRYPLPEVETRRPALEISSGGTDLIASPPHPTTEHLMPLPTFPKNESQSGTLSALIESFHEESYLIGSQSPGVSQVQDAKCQMHNRLRIGGQLVRRAGCRPLARFFIWPTLVVFGLVVAAASGLVWTETFASPGGEIDTFYGLPLSWKESIELVCSPLHPKPASRRSILPCSTGSSLQLMSCSTSASATGCFSPTTGILEKGPARVRS